MTHDVQSGAGPAGTMPPSACPGHCGLSEAFTRRAFMERSALAALGTLMAACGDGVFGVTPIASAVLAPGATYNIVVADYPALASVGGIATTTLAGVPIAIGRIAANAYAIWSMVCPHQGQQVVPSGSGFMCPGHNATWNASGAWTGGQSTGPLTVIPSAFDPATGVIAINGGAAPAVEQDFTIDITANPTLQTVGGWMFVTKPIPSGGTTKIVVFNTPAQGYIAYAAACGHQGRYLNFSIGLGHWKCPEHDAEYDIYGKKLKNATDNTNVPTAASLVMLTVTQQGNILRIRGNSPPQGTGF